MYVPYAITLRAISRYEKKIIDFIMLNENHVNKRTAANAAVRFNVVKTVRKLLQRKLYIQYKIFIFGAALH